MKLNVPFFNGSPEDYVHAGHYRNVRSTGYEIVGALARAIDGRSVLKDGAQMPNALEALYITGHSLGAASAAMLAIMLVTEPQYKPILSKLKAVYTFAQPMITSPQLAEKCNANAFLRESVIRYVYKTTSVRSCPPKSRVPSSISGRSTSTNPRAAAAHGTSTKSPESSCRMCWRS